MWDLKCGDKRPLGAIRAQLGNRKSLVLGVHGALVSKPRDGLAGSLYLTCLACSMDLGAHSATLTSTFGCLPRIIRLLALSVYRLQETQSKPRCLATGGGISVLSDMAHNAHHSAERADAKQHSRQVLPALGSKTGAWWWGWVWGMQWRASPTLATTPGLPGTI
ncbi:hypothetical protein GGTG_09258 [Gaeumannomyces tritici R3-111a-1]|uniref:Uncharacterized protein n=1 Tax=Gaeumannomyces tritici (strain R3-111a-1) TaxID=644352 RepID=J3P6W6_GAET3|nr:hypothetical protein GGTG_09258 [Gaeumannomyces tritici R3-111a-1]EJT72392.1 hypothetical protein GGTG_09258 [Gaeumannomyces tritici R3-111a-1]